MERPRLILGRLVRPLAPGGHFLQLAMQGNKIGLALFVGLGGGVVHRRGSWVAEDTPLSAPARTRLLAFHVLRGKIPQSCLFFQEASPDTQEASSNTKAPHDTDEKVRETAAEALQKIQKEEEVGREGGTEAYKTKRLAGQCPMTVWARTSR